MFGTYSRAELEALADKNIFPSSLGLGDTGDTSKKYLSRGVDDADADGVIAAFDEAGVEEYITEKQLLKLYDEVKL